MKTLLLRCALPGAAVSRGLLATAWLLSSWVATGLPQAHASPAEIGVVVMHGKASSPGKAVSAIASELQSQGMQVANVEMPWSGRRGYDVDLSTGVDEVTAALDALRSKGASKLFAVGHSQGALFAVLYGGRHKVDGIVAVAPGGQVDLPGFTQQLGDHVALARKMVNEGRGAEKGRFADFEGRRGVSSVGTAAGIYLSWFDPQGEHTSHAFSKVKPGTPVLYVAPTREHPALARMARANFTALPPHPASRMIEPETDHMGAPSAAAREVASWIRTVGSGAGEPR